MPSGSSRKPTAISTGNMPPLPGIFPDYQAPVVFEGSDGRTLAMMRWGMPSPAFALKNRKTDTGVTNVRNTKSPHWRRWLSVEHRCVVPFTSFSEYRKGPGRPEAVWFALDGSRPLAFFAGIWTNGHRCENSKRVRPLTTCLPFSPPPPTPRWSRSSQGHAGDPDH